MIEDNRREKSSLILRTVGCIQSKQENTTWDFKRQWYSPTNSSDLLHDIICMANQAGREDGLIIVGVDEENDYEICGVDHDPNRRKTQDLVCILRDRKFAGGIRPVVRVETFKLDNRSVDVIVISNSKDTPYYLTENAMGLYANHIYTRVMDTNTPKNGSADINVVEALWRKRFGIDEPALDKAFIYLRHESDWTSIHDEMSYYYKYAPEFIIEHEQCEETRDGYEYYMFSQTDSRPHWYYINVKYHQTILYNTLGVALDGGRYFTSIPNSTSFHSNNENQAIFFSSFTENTRDYAIHDFYYNLSPNGDATHARNAFLDCVPVFHSETEKESFLQYASEKFSRDRKIIWGYSLPVFPKSLPNKQMIEYFKREYEDAIIVKDMLNEYRLKKVINIEP